MRQDVCSFNYRSNHRAGSNHIVNQSLVLLVVACCGLQVGCQAGNPFAPRQSQPISTNYGGPTFMKPQTQLTASQGGAASATKQTPYPALTAATSTATPLQTASLGQTATVRGQSPQGWPNQAFTPPPTTPPVNQDPNVNRYSPPQFTAPTTMPPPTGFTPAQTPGASPVIGGATTFGNRASSVPTYGPSTTQQPPATTVFQPQVPPINSPQTYGVPAYGPSASTPDYGYSGSPSDYGTAIAPGAVQGGVLPGDSGIAPGVAPYIDPNLFDPAGGIVSPEAPFQPNRRIAPIDVFVQEARTGRIIVGGSVNSDLGVAGQVIIDERNFDIRRFPRSWSDLWSGRAFRGAGQNFRAELMPGTQVERYTVNWTERNLFGYLPYSLSVGGFLFTRQFRDWTEQRLGGRVALGYEVTRDISVSSELRMEDVKIFDPRLTGVSQLDEALGSNDIYTARFRVAHDTRDSPFMATQGSLLEVVFDQVFGEYDYSRGNLNYSRYFLVRERPDGTGRHTIASTMRVGVTGSQTPIFENYFAGGYSTLRGFSFRGASPVEGDVQVGGEFQFLGSLEYVFPLTADEMLRGVAFVDYGTVEQDLEINSENFRVAPGLGLRVSVPALGPAPLAFDFAYPINHADTDDRQVFSFFMGFTR